MQTDALHGVVAHEWLAIVGLHYQEDDGWDDRDVSNSGSRIVGQTAALRRGVAGSGRRRSRLRYLRKAARRRRWSGAQRSTAILAECGTGRIFCGAGWTLHGNSSSEMLERPRSPDAQGPTITSVYIGLGDGTTIQRLSLRVIRNLQSCPVTALPCGHLMWRKELLHG